VFEARQYFPGRKSRALFVGGVIDCTMAGSNASSGVSSDSAAFARILLALAQLQQQNDKLDQKVRASSLARGMLADIQMESYQTSTQKAISSMQAKLEAPSIETPKRIRSSSSVRSITPQDALSSSPPGPPAHFSLLSSVKKPVVPENLNVDVETFVPSSTEEKKDNVSLRSTFEHTKGNWGNRIVLTTYPNQSNVGTFLTLILLNLDPFPLKWYEPDPLVRGPSNSPRNTNVLTICSPRIASSGHNPSSQCNWCSWGKLLHLPCPGYRNRSTSCNFHAQLHLHATACYNRSISTVESPREDCVHGSMGTFNFQFIRECILARDVG
jgi:hypothetical protein